MVNYCKLYLLLSVIFLLTGCARKTDTLSLASYKNKAAKLFKSEQLMQPIYLSVEDVECDDCAESVLEILANVEEVDKANYFNVEDDYKNAYIKVCLKPNSHFPEALVNNLLKEEGFSLAKITSNPSQYA